MIERESENLPPNPFPNRANDLAEMFPSMVRYFSRRTGNPTIAEDLASQSTLRALEGLPKYQERGLPFSAWVFKIAGHELATYFKRNKQHQYLDSEEVLEISTEDKQTDPYENAEIMKCINALPQSEREAIMLRLFSNLTYKEISLVLKKPPGNIATYYSKGISRLRREMSTYLIKSLE